jgi:hypothetical protein
MQMATDILKKQTQDRIKRVTEQTGIPEADVIDRALDVLLMTEEMAGIKELADDTHYWQERYFDTLALEDERLAELDYDKGRDMGE